MIAALLAASIAVSSIGAPPLRGTATWYRAAAGHAAAGSELRHWLGRGWRGQWVRVCHADSCTRVVLTDSCACKGARIIDLDYRNFKRLAALSRGVIGVRIYRSHHP